MKERKTIRSALSTENGIITFSNIIRNLGIETYYDKNGEIKYRTVMRNNVKPIYLIRYEKKAKKVTKIWSFILALILIIIAFAKINVSLFLPLIYLLEFDALKDIVFLYYTSKFFKEKNSQDGNSMARFHAAEHMSIKAYRRHQRVPTYKEVEEETRISKFCGSLGYINRAFSNFINLLILFLISININNISNITNKILMNYNIIEGAKYYLFLILISTMLVLVVISIVLIIQVVIEEYSLLRFMEVLYTSKPTKKEINLAIKAVEHFEEMEEAINRVDLNEFDNGRVVLKY